MMIKDEIMPKIKADVRLCEDGSLIIEIDDIKKVERVFIFDNTIFCKSFYRYIEDEKI